MKMQEIVSPEFQDAIKELSSIQVSIVTAYKLSDLLEKATSELSKFRKLHAQLLLTYGELDSQGRVKLNNEGTEYIVKDRDAFNKEYEGLLSLDVEMPKISLDDLKDLKITTKSLSRLKQLIKP